MQEVTNVIRYNGELKQITPKTIKRTKKGKIINLCTDILTFDIETSNLYRDESGKTFRYEKGNSADYWNDLEKFAIPYIWQFSYNDKVYYGREFKDFLKVLKDLDPGVQYIIWVHNLSFEFVFLQNIIKFQGVFAREPHKPIKADYKNIQFRCSYTLTNLSLEKWGDQLGVPKLSGTLDYDLYRTPLTPLFDFELDYAEQDCIVVFAGIKDHLKKYKTVWDIPLTSTGKVRKELKKILNKDDDYMKEIKRCIPNDAQQYKLFQTVFAGGYTHGNRKYVGDLVKGQIHHVDIASSYPFVMCAKRFPYDRWGYIGTGLPDPSTFERRAYIIKLHFTGLKCISWNTYIQAAKSRGSGFVYDNGRILSADELYITVTEQDYITICNNYVWDSIESMGTYTCRKKFLPPILVNFILDLYKNKTELKGFPEGSPEDELYKISKQYINSVFGMGVTSLFQSDVVFDQNALDEWTIQEISEEKVNTKLEKLKIWYDKRYFVSYPAGCWITAYARRRLWECIERCDADLLYTDTDSLFYLGDYDWSWFNERAAEELMEACKEGNLDFNKTRPKDKKGIEHPLGVLDFEPDCDQFKTLGAKKYIEHRDDQLFMTVAGINKGAVKCLENNIDNFQDGFQFDKDHPAVQKLEHTYLSDMQPVTFIDGYHSDFTHGVHLRPTGYKLSVPDMYKDLLDLMNGIVPISQNYNIKRRGFLR